MKRVVKKNQIVLTLLAVMIAVAGYLSYAGRFDFSGGEEQAQADGTASEETVAAGLLDISEDDILAGKPGGFPDGRRRTDRCIRAGGGGRDRGRGRFRGAAGNRRGPAGRILCARGSSTDQWCDRQYYVSQVQLNREQVRSKNKETLLEVINNSALSDEQKQSAVDQMIQLTAVAEKENAAETLLGAKGFTDSVVCINGDTVDVVVGKTELTDAERAQIEDIVKRKTEVDAANVVITLMELDQ